MADQALLELTRKMYEQVDQATYEQFEAYVNERQLWIERLQLKNGESGTSINGLREKIDEIMYYDKVILERMIRLKEEAESGLKKIRQGRLQKKSYDKAYTMDGLYFDKKK